MSAPKFVGSSGEDWCARPAQLGPPDTVNEHQLQWLIVPGPPISCYLASIFPRQDPTPMTYYHSHPSTWSIHVVLAGAGRYHAEGTGHDIGPGSVLYHGPGVRHSLYPLPNQPLVHLSIQHPAAGWTDKQWQPHPEAGTAESFGEADAFLRLFGTTSPEEFARRMIKEPIFTSGGRSSSAANRSESSLVVTVAQRAGRRELDDHRCGRIG
jgi:mannose-6-phosphate isomerase-like protein (cupin superfamily)